MWRISAATIQSRKLWLAKGQFAEHKFVVGSDKEAGTGAEKHNDHEVVNINDAKVNFNKNLILLTASIQIRKKKCVIMFTENKWFLFLFFTVLVMKFKKGLKSVIIAHSFQIIHLVF